MQPTQRHDLPRRRRGAAVLAAAAALIAVVWPVQPGIAAPDPAVEATSSGLREVGRLPLLEPPELDNAELGGSGWLILNPATRRGYQVFEARNGRTRNRNRTILQSFDLDTLRPLRRGYLAGLPVTSGAGDPNGPGGTTFAGEIVHAVDFEARRIYLALSQAGAVEHTPGALLNVGSPSDGQRVLSRLVAIDEDAFDRCAGAANCAFAASFREPPDQARLHSYWLEGLAVSRHRTTNGVGRLLALFASPQPGSTANPSPVYDHTLAQWEPSGLTFGAGAAMATDPDSLGLTVTGESTVPSVAAAGLARRLDVCDSASLASGGAYGRGNYQWGVLALRDEVWTACQAASGSGAAVRVALDGAGNLEQVGGQELFRLSQSISDVLVDPGGRRLLVRSFGNGQTWWVFDTGLRRFTGAAAAKATDYYALAAGLDPATGRLYQLLQDHEANGVPLRGGFSYSDTRLDPAPAMENVRPDLAYPSVHRIQVDPPTRRVFARFGHTFFTIGPLYPGTQSTTQFPQDFAYRVFEDTIPVAERPPPPDDRVFTTDVAESNLTQASYLGQGQGYGVRAWLVGGLDAATNRTVVGHEQSPCGKDDRELLAGSVGGVEVSDLTTRADAASLDGDGKTQDHLGVPVARCKPKSAPMPPATAETSELAFDEPNKDGRDGDGDLRADRDGVNRYRTTCTGDEGEKKATAPPNKMVSRHNFSARSGCRYSHGTADAEATGAFGSRELDQAQGADAEHVRVGHAHSEVTVTRKAGEGVTVKVDSIARDIVIPGIGVIGLVRGEATVTATGRPGGATASYRRTICDVHIGPLHHADCRNETEQEEFAAQMNTALGTRGKVRFRPPDPTLYAGSRSGYKAGVQRPESDGFEDVRIARDVSPALPAMELVLYNGDSAGGTGRQFLHFAGVYAGGSYGIACLYGQRDDGRCARADEGLGEDVDFDTGSGSGEPEVVVEYVQGEPVEVPGPPVAAGNGRRSLIRRIVEAPVELVKDVLRLLFANPREFGLMAAVWALLYAPCYLGERRRSIQALRARRAAVVGG